MSVGRFTKAQQRGLLVFGGPRGHSPIRRSNETNHEKGHVYWQVMDALEAMSLVHAISPPNYVLTEQGQRELSRLSR